MKLTLLPPQGPPQLQKSYDGEDAMKGAAEGVCGCDLLQGEVQKQMHDVPIPGLMTQEET